MCFICNQSEGFETDIATIIKSNENPTLKVNQTSSFKLQTPITGPNQNKYTFEISGIEQSHSLYEVITKNSIAAIEYAASKFKWKGVIDFVAKIGGKKEWYSKGNGFGGYGNPDILLHETTTGVDLYSERPDGWDEWSQVDWDAGSWINLNKANNSISNYGNPIFIDPNPIPEDSSSIPLGHQDFFSIYMHEFFHTFGVNSYAKVFNDSVYEKDGESYFKGEAINSELNSDLKLDKESPGHYAVSYVNHNLMGGSGWETDIRSKIRPMDQALYGDIGYGIVRDTSDKNDNIIGGLGDDLINLKGGKDTIKGRSGDDVINGGSDFDTAIYSGNFADYKFSIDKKIITITDTRASTNDGTDTLSHIEKLTFADKNALVTSKEIKSINFHGFQSKKVYPGISDTYKFYALGENQYGIGTANGIDALTGQSVIQFDDQSLNLATDIKSTFDQVTGLNTASGEMFRLYNAAFARFPDADGLKYWIDQFSSGRNTRRVVAQSFLGSAEFTDKYGSNVSDETYVNNLYKNVLGRDADTEGLNYWVGNLSSGLETRYEALLGFAESAENKALFTEMTGFA